MIIKEHIEEHKDLHKALDRLCADFLTQTGRLLSETTVTGLMEWSKENIDRGELTHEQIMYLLDRELAAIESGNNDYNFAEGIYSLLA